MFGEHASDKVPRLTGRATPQIESGCPNRNQAAGSGTPCRSAALDTSGGRRRWLDWEERSATTVLAVSWCGQLARYGRLGDAETEHYKLTLNPWSTPEKILTRHSRRSDRTPQVKVLDARFASDHVIALSQRVFPLDPPRSAARSAPRFSATKAPRRRRRTQIQSPVEPGPKCLRAGFQAQLGFRASLRYVS